ncbi:MAG: hypothetical protein OEY58_19695 [Gammaproteobacteria bacterium]|nr:hypothetical protein [Gammaproteobacteria bacterium]
MPKKKTIKKTIKPKATIKQHSTINTYGYLMSAAHHAKGRLKEEEGQFYQAMTTMILSAFTLEAYLNHVGEKLFPYWDDMAEFKKLMNAGYIDQLANKYDGLYHYTKILERLAEGLESGAIQAP